jgi:hypothetical protein
MHTTPIDMNTMKSPEDLFHLVDNGTHTSLDQEIANLLSVAASAVDRHDQIGFSLQQHPLGFLCAKWNVTADESLRIHMWDRDMKYVQRPNWPIHDHVFSFRSAVLRGKVQNKFYQLAECGGGRECEIFEVDYSKEKSILIQTGKRAFIRPVSATTHSAGQEYVVDAGALHRTILRSNFAITVLAARTSHSLIQKPRVIGTTDGEDLTYNRRIARPEDVRKQLGRARSSLIEV